MPSSIIYISFPFFSLFCLTEFQYSHSMSMLIYFTQKMTRELISNISSSTALSKNSFPAISFNIKLCWLSYIHSWDFARTVRNDN
ncbi:hypothetical protein Pint_12280 [Pistacia integerrima]|uniref:Uncharacterized protein n=1 Tax=Pistacia integerrima TaxID=434235 RepID=A0ACC0XJP1_9ROSI|nr:hypothetical protein Pint_12280 [Pistacia integerrima]